ncbi:MAG: hypothetical protein AAFR37_20035, partial [Cyanobacteria bacterium J06628_3]
MNLKKKDFSEEELSSLELLHGRGKSKSSAVQKLFYYLTDFQFISQKIHNTNNFGLDSLIKDYNLLNEP